MHFGKALEGERTEGEKDGKGGKVEVFSERVDEHPERREKADGEEEVPVDAVFSDVLLMKPGDVLVSVCFTSMNMTTGDLRGTPHLSPSPA